MKIFKFLFLTESIFFVSVNFCRPIIHIFIHGTLGGMHTYKNMNRTRPSLKTLVRYFKDVSFGLINNVTKANKSLYYNDQSFSLHKGRKFYFESDSLPLFVGVFPGLSRIDEQNQNGVLTPTAYKKILVPFMQNITLSSNRLVKADSNYYYIFNWNGGLSGYDRADASEKFLLDLEQKIFTLYEDPIIYVYAFSHGGNIILEALSKSNFKIEKLFLLGAPIGKKTVGWIKSSKIGILYNFYSNDDFVQNSDFIFNFPKKSERVLPKELENQRCKNILVNYYFDNLKISYRHQNFFIYNKNDFKGGPFFIFIPLILQDINKKSDFNMVMDIFDSCKKKLELFIF